MIALGLLLLVVAAVVALVGIFTNLGSSHQIGRTVNLLGYHLHGSTGKLLLVGVVIGAVGMLGLSVLLAGIGRGFRRSVSQRKEHRSDRRQTEAVVQDRDHVAADLDREHAARVHAEEQRDSATAMTSAASTTTARPGVRHLGRHERVVSKGDASVSAVEEPGDVPHREL